MLTYYNCFCSTKYTDICCILVAHSTLPMQSSIASTIGKGALQDLSPMFELDAAGYAADNTAGCTGLGTIDC